MGTVALRNGESNAQVAQDAVAIEFTILSRSCSIEGKGERVAVTEADMYNAFDYEFYKGVKYWRVIQAARRVVDYSHFYSPIQIETAEKIVLAAARKDGKAVAQFTSFQMK